jgi:hypothetical protein
LARPQAQYISHLLPPPLLLLLLTLLLTLLLPDMSTTPQVCSC